MSIWEQISQFVADNKEMITTGTLLTFISGIAGYYGVKYVLPSAINKVVLFLSKVIGKMFGLEVEGVSEQITELPIIQKMNDWERELNIQNELKLIELKNKIISPKLSDAERIAYQGMYDKIIREMGDKVSVSTKLLLEAIEKAASKKLGL